MWQYLERGLFGVILLFLPNIRGTPPPNQHFDYDEDLAKLSVLFSSAAYQKDPTVSDWTFTNPECNLKTPGFVVVETYTGDSTEAFGFIGLDSANQRIVVAFKGTSDLRDWMTDLRTWLRYNRRCNPDSDSPSPSSSSVSRRLSMLWPSVSTLDDNLFIPDEWAKSDDGDFKGSEGGGGGGGGEGLISEWYDGGTDVSEWDDDDGPPEGGIAGNVHYGFCQYYQSIVEQGFAKQAVKLADEYPDYTFFVTGHSLGAAAAAISAADLTQRLGIAKNRVVLYTLGEPRTGDGIFAENLKRSVGTAYRVVHNRDVVPHLSICCHDWRGKCTPGAEACPYQHSSEVLYANDMAPGENYTICSGCIGEDYACDPQSVDLSVSDHTHYFEVLVGDFCSTIPEEAEPFSLMKEKQEAHWAELEDAMLWEQVQRLGASGHPLQMGARLDDKVLPRSGTNKVRPRKIRGKEEDSPSRLENDIATG